MGFSRSALFVHSRAAEGASEASLPALELPSRPSSEATPPPTCASLVSTARARRRTGPVSLRLLSSGFGQGIPPDLQRISECDSRRLTIR